MTPWEAGLSQAAETIPAGWVTTTTPTGHDPQGSWKQLLGDQPKQREKFRQGPDFAYSRRTVLFFSLCLDHKPPPCPLGLSPHQRGPQPSFQLHWHHDGLQKPEETYVTCLLLAREGLLEELLCSKVSGHFLAQGKRKAAWIGGDRGLWFGGARLCQTLLQQLLVSLSFYRSCRLTAFTYFPNSNLSKNLLIFYKLLTIKHSLFF